MYPPERHQEILRRARDQGRIEVGVLADALSVTPETIRRDLTALEGLGLLRRVHGGAVAVLGAAPRPAPEESDAAVDARAERIAKAALAEVPDSGSIVLDAGSITLRLAELLPTERELTVVTRSLTIASMISRRPNLSLHLLGGRVRDPGPATAGHWADRAVDGMFVDVAFVTALGVTPERGVTDPEPRTAALNRACLGAARHTVVLADHTRFDADQPVTVVGLDAVDLVVSDSGLDPRSAEMITASGPRIELA